jgi:hypothetical protein
MTDYEVSQRLGYDPCVCGKIDGTWHPECYRGKKAAQIAAGYKRAFAAARLHLKAKEHEPTPMEPWQAGLL